MSEMNIAETRKLDELSVIAGDQYPNTDLSVAMIAQVPPPLLKEVLQRTFNQQADARSCLSFADSNYNFMLKVLNGHNYEDIPESVQEAARDLNRAEENHLALENKMILAKNVRNTKKRLSRPMRFSAILLSGLALGGSVGVFDADHDPGNLIPKTVTVNPLKLEVPPVAAGVVAGMLGGLIGLFVGSQLEGDVAHRRALRIIAEAQHTTPTTK